MLEFEELKIQLQEYDIQLDNLKDALNYNNTVIHINTLEALMIEENFWDDIKTSQDILQQINQLKSKIKAFDDLIHLYRDP